LADLVIPSIMEGLLEIAKNEPEDALDYLVNSFKIIMFRLTFCCKRVMNLMKIPV